MPVLKFWDGTQYQPVTGFSVGAGTGGTDEVEVSSTGIVPTDSGIELWIDESIQEAPDVVSGVPTGSITVFAGAVAPEDWLLCNGASVLIADYSKLYDVIGTTYGTGLGDGLTFSLPNLIDRVPVAAGGSYALGAVGGEAAHVLSEGELASHAHSLYDPGHAHGVADPTHGHMQTTNTGGTGEYTRWDYSGEGNMAKYQHGVTTEGSGTGLGIYGSGTGMGVNPAGGNAAHNNMQPYLALHYIIKL